MRDILKLISCGFRMDSVFTLNMQSFSENIRGFTSLLEHTYQYVFWNIADQVPVQKNSLYP